MHALILQRLMVDSVTGPNGAHVQMCLVAMATRRGQGRVRIPSLIMMENIAMVLMKKLKTVLLVKNLSNKDNQLPFTFVDFMSK